MKKIAILSAVRTPVANFNGSFTNINAVKLGSLVIKAAIDRAGIEAKDIDEVIMGNVLQAGLGQNPARQAAILAGIPNETPALTINKVCGSGLKSIVLAAQSILAGDNDIVVAGGMENMSAAPFAVNKVRQGIKMGDTTLVDTMVHDGLTCAMNHYHMGITAENIANKYQISRQEQDEFALLSQQRAVNAIENNLFKNEILPIEITSKKESKLIETDEFPRKDVTIEQLSRLRPAFEKNGSVTAGNSSGINDGAAAFVLMDADKAQALGLKAMAYIKSYASAGVDPQIMGMGPVPATQKALKKANLQLQDLNYIEANEAFAAQFLGVNRELKLDIDKTNIHGGAIALGHPIGASGTRILTTLTHTLINQNAQYGLATLCIGGGQGIAMIIERP